MRSYSNEVLINYDATNVTGDTNFASTAAQVLPTKSNAAQASVLAGQIAPSVRRLHASQVVAATGIIKTAGTGTISIGDGVTAARYGTIALVGGTANTSAQFLIALTEEGFRMGLNQADTLKETFTLTYSGTAVITGLKLSVGYF